MGEVVKDADEALAGIIADLQKMADTPEGSVKAQHVCGDIERLTKAGDVESIEMAQRFIDHGGDLHKRIGQHWLDRAHAIVNGREGKVAAATKAPMNVHPRLQRLRDLARRGTV